jgi:pimeloyl-ACP methyl ester carboxylesterase
MGTRTPLILIHGLDGDSSMPPSSTDLYMFQNLSNYLSSDSTFVSNYKIFTFNYLSNVYTVSQIGAALETWMDYFRTSWDPYSEGDTPFDRDVVIIGHSMGGLVSRALMNENTVAAGAQAGVPAGARVLRLITLSTPHHGSALTNDTNFCLHGQSNLDWQLVLTQLSAAWIGTSAASDIDAPNRGDLLADQYYANLDYASTPSLYSSPDVNTWLDADNLITTYNGKINAYYGVLGSYEDVPTYGSDSALQIDLEIGSLALQLGSETGGVFSTGFTTAELPAADEFLQVSSVILERIDTGNFSGNITSVANDGLVPDFSGRFDGASVFKIVKCVNTTHMDVIENTGGTCTDEETQKTGSIFTLLDADLESIVSLNNPSPTLTSISPSSGAVGAAALPLTVDGTDFVSGATVLWNGTPLQTTFVNSTQLTAAVPASDLVTGGSFPVTVANPSPGGATSGPQTFSVTNPAPTVASLLPATATAGGAAFTLTVTGTNFVAASIVDWNGNPLPTTYVSGAQLTAAVPAADIATAGSASITVVNPAPGGGTSTALAFTIDNPVPSATALSPSSATAGGAAFTLTVTGTNFISGASVDWNGSSRTTTYVSATQLTAAILAGDIATAGTASVTVVNPAPGGGTSNPVPFSVNAAASSIAISSLSTSSLTVVQGGASATVTVNLTRSNYTGSVTLSTSTLPSGVTATITQPGTGNSGTIALSAASGAAAVSNQTVTITASGSGATSVTAAFNLTVEVPPSIAISASPGSVTLTAGGSAQTVTVNVTETSYTGSVTLATSALPAGVTVAITQPGTGTSGSISLAAAAGAATVSSQTITVTASGSGVSSATATFSLTVNPAPSIAISASPSSVTLTAGGSAQTVTVTVAETNYTGSVALAASNLPSGVIANITQPGTGNSGSIILTAAGNAAVVANQTVTVTASGSGVSPATATFSLTVNLVPSITISASPSSVAITAGGSAQTVTVNVTDTDYTGSVTLATSTLPSGVTAAITQPGTGASGSISLSAAAGAATVSNQTVTITASGSGVSSAPATFSLTVNPASAFSLSISPGSDSVTAGQSASYTLSVTPVGGFNQQVSLTCTGAPSEATCSVSPASVTLNGTDTAKPTVTVTTTAASQAAPGRRFFPPGTARPPAFAWFAWLFLLLASASLAAARRRRIRFSPALLAATALLLLTLAACGGGSSANTSNAGTPAGTYTLTLTGTYTGSSGTMTRTTTATLTVN